MRVSPVVVLKKAGLEFLKERRIKQVGSQKRVARISHFSQSMISDWENRNHRPSLAKLKEYLKFLKIDPSKFLKNSKYVSKVIDIYKEIPTHLKVKRLTKEKAYVLGVLGPGDGHVSQKQIKLGVTDEDFINEFCKSVKASYGYEPSVYSYSNYSVKYAVCCSKSIVNDVESFNVSFKEKTWRVPKEIKNSSIEIKAAYLRGVFDSQGSVNFVPARKVRNVNLRSFNSRGLEEIQKLLLDLGIRSSLGDNNRRLYIYGRKNIERFSKLINFSIQRKSQDLKKALESYVFYKSSPKIIKTLVPEMKKLRRKGFSFAKIANKLNEKYNLSITPSTVRNRLNKASKSMKR